MKKLGTEVDYILHKRLFLNYLIQYTIMMDIIAFWKTSVGFWKMEWQTEKNRGYHHVQVSMTEYMFCFYSLHEPRSFLLSVADKCNVWSELVSNLNMMPIAML